MIAKGNNLEAKAFLLMKIPFQKLLRDVEGKQKVPKVISLYKWRNFNQVYPVRFKRSNFNGSNIVGTMEISSRYG